MHVYWSVRCLESKRGKFCKQLYRVATALMACHRLGKNMHTTLKTSETTTKKNHSTNRQTLVLART